VGVGLRVVVDVSVCTFVVDDVVVYVHIFVCAHMCIRVANAEVVCAHGVVVVVVGALVNVGAVVLCASVVVVVEVGVGVVVYARVIVVARICIHVDVVGVVCAHDVVGEIECALVDVGAGVVDASVVVDAGVRVLIGVVAGVVCLFVVGVVVLHALVGVVAGLVGAPVIVGVKVGALAVKVTDSKLESELVSKSAFAWASHLSHLELLWHGSVVRLVCAGGRACAFHREMGALVVDRIVAFTADQVVILSFLFIIGLAARSLLMPAFPWCRW